MTLRQLRIFLEVCSTGKITQAAENLYLPQSVVSLAVSELEEYYGVKLFDRIARRIHITPQGERLREYASRIIALSDESVQSLRDSSAGGILRVGGSIAVGAILLPKLVAAFGKISPKNKVVVQINTSENIVQAIVKNQLDIGIVEQNADHSQIFTKTIYEDDMVFVCTPQHPFAKRKNVSIDELMAQPLLLRDQSSASRYLLDSHFNALSDNAPIIPQWESISNTALSSAVKQNLGITYVPRHLVYESLRDGTLCEFPVDGIHDKRTFTLIYHKDKFLSPAHTSFIEHCINYVREMSDSI
ncbi:MAG: LysR family transcriptional regulator [Clostridiales bacterium]|uniref:LysR family transcriptional regulator n=1 Tax=Flavonifractor porci TaxID=3133422 RepID=UPI00309A27C9|nr:LysR family transcriptional regulator [Clostridiales bacterium]